MFWIVTAELNSFAPNTVSWPAVLCVSAASVCITLAVVHSSIWARNRKATAHLAFAALSLGVAFFTWCCLLMMRAPNPHEFARALWWTNTAVLWMVVAGVTFVRLYFPVSRAWIGYSACALRVVAMAGHTARYPASDFDIITTLRSVEFLGDRVSVAEGLTSVWFYIGQSSLLLFSIFIVDASISLWRSGTANARRRALRMGVPFALFVGGGAISAALIFSGIAEWPHLEFVPVLAILGAMAYELSDDVLRAARVSEELRVSEAALRESERRMTMAADAARLGMWIWDLDTGTVWLTAQCREMLGIPPEGTVTQALFAERLHPGDRDRLDEQVGRAVETGVLQQTEYRIMHPDGSVHWIAAHLAVDRDAGGRAYQMRGVCMDVTQQRHAERTAHELSGRLINAQEDERRRLARDLHDDLNQRISLLSVELELLGRGLTGKPVEGFAQLATQIRHLSTEVHKMSYQLHPAKLDQLGLETALRSWCRDVAHQSGVAVSFTAAGVPKNIPAEPALCLYRIAQEALRNVVRHSGATSAMVELAGNQSALRLVVSDGGNGFDANDPSTATGLGLLSMRERAHLSRGTLHVESSSGRGTRIAVSIPLSPSTLDAARDGSRARPAAYGG